ncbi:DUF4349 domain-containing protein [Gorillibacterium sp. CAU 1737]|uniref:DUF4349 domain-containing protein n=1 Tax=Gorillibacterium sp. CAU 1737 TaxID=3140362 RepID=UPI0032604A8F
MAWKRVRLLLAVGCLIAVLVGCSANKSDSAAGSYEAETAAAKPQAVGSTTGNESAPITGALTEGAQFSSSADKKVGGLQAEIEPTAAMNRKLIYRANLSLVVKEYTEAQAEIRSIVAGSGGYILTFTEEERSGVWSGQFTAKVPSKGLNDLLAKLDQIPTIKKNRSVEGTDVSEEYVDLEARLKVKEATEARLLEFLAKANQTDDLVKFVDQLDQVQAEIEQAKGKMKYIDQNVALSTVDIDLSEKKAAVTSQVEKKTLGASIKRAFGLSIGWVGAFLRGLLIFIVAAIPIVTILAVAASPGYFIWRKIKKTGSKRDQTP